MEIKFTNYEYNGKSINIEISDKKIIGVTGKNKEEFISLITLEKLNCIVEKNRAPKLD